MPVVAVGEEYAMDIMAKVPESITLSGTFFVLLHGNQRSAWSCLSGRRFFRNRHRGLRSAAQTSRTAPYAICRDRGCTAATLVHQAI